MMRKLLTSASYQVLLQDFKVARDRTRSYYPMAAIIELVDTVKRQSRYREMRRSNDHKFGQPIYSR